MTPNCQLPEYQYPFDTVPPNAQLHSDTARKIANVLREEKAKLKRESHESRRLVSVYAKVGERHDGAISWALSLAEKRAGVSPAALIDQVADAVERLATYHGVCPHDVKFY